MVKQRGEGSVKRFGARYGRKVRARLAQVEIERMKKSKCPYCAYPKVKRIAAGIYVCSKCKSKFTGQAYSVAKERAKLDTKKTQRQMYADMEEAKSQEEENEEPEDDQEQ